MRLLRNSNKTINNALSFPCEPRLFLFSIQAKLLLGKLNKEYVNLWKIGLKFLYFTKMWDPKIKSAWMKVEDTEFN